ncbi:MAG: hypothetical protein E3J72_00760 [Planctomycetota bacterium]|nr:MAG: hypothetical protein E3J72_00760 [Planctomycetota bacterium]
MSDDSATQRTPHDPFVVPPERREAIFKWMVDKVDRYGLEVPAVFVLELMKPLSFILSQLCLFGAPVLYPFFGMERTEHFAQFLSERENVEELIQRIERRAAGE